MHFILYSIDVNKQKQRISNTESFGRLAFPFGGWDTVLGLRFGLLSLPFPLAPPSSLLSTALLPLGARLQGSRGDHSSCCVPTHLWVRRKIPFVIGNHNSMNTVSTDVK